MPNNHYGFMSSSSGGGAGGDFSSTRSFLKEYDR